MVSVSFGDINISTFFSAMLLGESGLTVAIENVFTGALAGVGRLDSGVVVINSPCEEGKTSRQCKPWPATTC